MNIYIEQAKREVECEILYLIREFERINLMKVDGINFKCHSMCDTQEQKIKMLDVVLACHSTV